MNDELYHYGVPGMKWGVHKGRSSGSISAGPGGGGSAVDLEELEENLDEAEEELGDLIANDGDPEEIQKLKRQIKEGKKRVEMIRQIAEKTKGELTHFMDHTVDEIYASDELYHFGVKGMHWGVRRFQPYQPGERVKGGKEVGLATKVQQRVGGIVEHYKQHKVKSQRTKNLKKANAARKTKAEHEAAKQKALSSGNADEVLKYKSELSSDEINKVINRLQNEKRLEDIAESTRKTGWDRVDSMMNKVAKVSGYVNTAAGLYENVNRMKKAAKAADDFDEEQEKAAQRKKIEKDIRNGKIGKLAKNKYATAEDIEKARRLQSTREDAKTENKLKKLGINDMVDTGDTEGLSRLMKDNDFARTAISKKMIDDAKSNADARKSIDPAEKAKKKLVDDAIKSGNVNEVLKYAKYMTNEQFNQGIAATSKTIAALKVEREYKKTLATDQAEVEKARQERYSKNLAKEQRLAKTMRNGPENKKRIREEKLKRMFGTGYRGR